MLSIDNALVLGILAKRLPKHQPSRALTYGLVGAFVFRLIAIALAAYLFRWWVVKLAGGGVPGPRPASGSAPGGVGGHDVA